MRKSSLCKKNIALDKGLCQIEQPENAPNRQMPQIVKIDQTRDFLPRFQGN